MQSPSTMATTNGRETAPRFLSIDQAARHAGLSPKSIRRMLAAGKLTAYRPVKGRVLIDRLQLDQAILASGS